MQRPTLRQLEYVIAIADTGQISLAAAKLNVSQPSLSAQLLEVETILGVTLFHRSRRGTSVTPAGEEIVRRARQILHEINDLCAIAKADGIFQGRLRLGVLPSIGPYLLPAVVRQLHRDHPRLRLIVREENTQDLDQGLRDGRLDMIISTPEDHAGTENLPIVTETLWAAMAVDHPLAMRRTTKVSLTDLAGQTLTTLSTGHRLSHIVANLAFRAGGHVSDEYEGTSLDAIRLMAAAGTGIAILPELYATTEARRAADVHLVAIDAPIASRDIALIIPKRHANTPDTEILAATLRNHAHDLIGRPITR